MDLGQDFQIAVIRMQCLQKDWGPMFCYVPGPEPVCATDNVSGSAKPPVYVITAEQSAGTQHNLAQLTNSRYIPLAKVLC